MTPKTEVFSGLVLLTPKPKDEERELVNQLFKTNDALISPINCKQREQNYDAGVKGVSLNEEGTGRRRYLRLSKEEITSAALDAVMEVLKGDPMTRKLSEEMLSTVNVDARRRRLSELEELLGLIKGECWDTIDGKFCKSLPQPDIVTVNPFLLPLSDREKKTNEENPISSDGYSEEITNLVRKLQLSDVVPSCAAITTPGRDIRDEARRLNITHERLRGRILLEIERSSTPKAPEAV